MMVAYSLYKYGLWYLKWTSLVGYCFFPNPFKYPDSSHAVAIAKHYKVSAGVAVKLTCRDVLDHLRSAPFLYLVSILHATYYAKLIHVWRNSDTTSQTPMSSPADTRRRTKTSRCNSEVYTGFASFGWGMYRFCSNEAAAGRLTLASLQQ